MIYDGKFLYSNRIISKNWLHNNLIIKIKSINNVYEYSSQIYQILFETIRYNFFNIFEEVLEKIKICIYNDKDNYNDIIYPLLDSHYRNIYDHPIFLSIQYGNKKIFQYLIECCHLKINEIYLEYAVENHSDLNIIKYLIDEQKQSLIVDQDNNVHIAYYTIIFDNIDMMKFLIEENKIKVYEELCLPKSETQVVVKKQILHLAFEYGSQKIIKYLLEEKKMDHIKLDMIMKKIWFIALYVIMIYYIILLNIML